MRRAALLVAVALVLSACSGDDADLVDATPPSGPVEPSAPPTAPTTTADVPTGETLPPSDPAESEGLEFRPVLAVHPTPCGRLRFEDAAGELCYELGPVAADETAIESADAVLDAAGATWQVVPLFLPGADGIDRFNAITQRCFAAERVCPTQQLAIVLDAKVISAPAVNATPTFERDEIQITGDFTEESAQDLAEALTS